MGDKALRGNKLTRKDVRKHFEEVRKAFPKDFAPGGKYGKRKDFKTHGKDIPTMAAQGGRAGFKKGRLAITKSDLAKRKLWKLRELKKKSQ